MKKLLCNCLFLALSIISGLYSINYFSGKSLMIGCFVSGLFAGIFLMNLKVNVKNDKIQSYKRELEKESVISGESSAKVKVLESKIEVLEKALENALKK